MVRTSLFAGLLTIVGVNAAAQVQVWVVTTPPAGLESAILAASDGDMVLVKGSGTYDPIIIQSKSLTVVADQGTDVRVNVTVRDLAASQRVELRGLRFLNDYQGVLGSDALPALGLLDNQGLVWIEECRVDGVVACCSAGAGIQVTRCADVVLLRTHSEGLSNSPSGVLGCNAPQTGHGLVVGGGSRIVAHDCLFKGADGWLRCDDTAVAGGDGVRSTSAGDRLFLSRCQAIGGRGEAYDDPFEPVSCSRGGAGLSSVGLTRVLDSVTQGGSSGSSPNCHLPDGPDQTGNVQSLQGQALRLEVSAPVREHQAIDLDVVGPPNTSIWLLVGGSPMDRFLPRGPLLIDAPRVDFVGTTDASGVLHTTQAMPLMAPGIEFGRLFLQGFYLDSRGRFVLSTASMFVALDETL